MVNEEKFLLDEIKKLQDERAKYQERYTILRKSLDSTDVEAEKIKAEIVSILSHF